jgi:hypothetical protein
MLRYTRWDDDEPEDWGGGWDVHEDTEWCPHCENYLSAEDAPPARKPWWIIIGAAACLLVVYFWVTVP